MKKPSSKEKKSQAKKRPTSTADAQRMPRSTCLAWAKTVVQFWQICLQNEGDQKPTRLVVLDLNPSDTESMWMLMQEIKRHYDQTGLRLPWTYVVCEKDEENRRRMREHPYLSHAAENGQFDTCSLPFNSQENADLSLYLDCQAYDLAQEIQVENTAIAVLAGQGFKHFPSELFHIHHGKIFSAQNNADIHSEIAWQELRIEEENEPDLAYYLQRYREKMSSAPVSIPLEAMRFLDLLVQHPTCAYLVLTRDFGAVQLDQIRNGAVSFQSASGNLAPLFNFETFSHLQERCGAWVHHFQWGIEREVEHLSCRFMPAQYAQHDQHADDAIETLSHQFDGLISTLGQAYGLKEHIASSLTHFEQTSDAACLSLFKACAFDPYFCLEIIQKIDLDQWRIARHRLPVWHESLDTIWENYFPNTRHEDAANLPSELGSFAAQIGHWRLAKHCLEISLELYGINHFDILCYALCLAETGDCSAALTLLRSYPEFEQESPAYAQCVREYQARINDWRENAHFEAPATANTELRLEPLGKQHSEGFLGQYRDPQIALMTRLPYLDTAQQYETWLASQKAEKGKHLFAVVHQDLGFVGVVCVHQAASSGFFYFWIGCDFQDRGYGQQAAHMLFTWAQAQGIDHLYTSVFDSNLRSSKSLAALEFAVINIQAQAPDEAWVFQHRALTSGSTLDEKTKIAQLVQLCEDIDSPLIF